jgi:protein NrfD
VSIGPDVAWGVLVALYIYLGGMAGGMWMMGFVADYYSGRRSELYPVAKTAAYLAPLVLGAGLLLLVLDLGRPGLSPMGLTHIVRVFDNPGSSPMTIGSMIIAAAEVLGIVLAVMYYANASRVWRLVFSGIAAALGFGTATYTGLLLAMARHMALWSNGWLAWLFAASGLSSGIAAVIIGTRILGSFTPDYVLPEFKKVREKWLEVAAALHRYDIAVLWVEMAFLIAMLIQVYVSYGALPVKWLVSTTSAAAAFWLYVVLGWAVPIALYYAAPRHSRANIYIGAVLIAVFALALRMAIVFAPQLAFVHAGFPLH